MAVTLHQLLTTLPCVPVLLFLFLFPGLAIGWWTNLLDFRTLPPRNRLCWSIALSFGVTPVLLYFAQLVAGFVGSLALLLLLALAAVPVLRTLRGSISWRAAVIGFAGLLMMLFMLVDLGTAEHLYASTPILDHGYRVEFVQTIARHGLPAINPLYHPGAWQPLRYYYYWYLVLAVPVHLLHLDARSMLWLSCFAAASGLVSVIVIASEEWLGWSQRKTGLACLLLAVTGLDILPTLGNLAQGMPLQADPEWWSIDQITSWADTMLWVPHHLAALVACLIALLMFLKAPSNGKRGWLILLAGLSLASTVGLSVYVGIAIAILLAVLLVWGFAQRRAAIAWSILLAGAVCVILSVPFLHDLAGREHSATGLPITFGIRQMIPHDVLTGFVPQLYATHYAATVQMLHAALLIPGYIAELGAFAFAFFLFKARNQQEKTLRFLTLAIFVITTLIRSNVVLTNDFAYRSALLLQFFLLLMIADVIAVWLQAPRHWSWQACTMAVLLGIGLISTVSQLLVLRGYTILYPQDSAVVADLQSSYAAMQHLVQPDAVIQWSPPPPTVAEKIPERIVHGLQLIYAERQTAMFDDDCDIPFGGDSAPCSALHHDMYAIYDHATAADAKDICKRWGIVVLVATARDAIWNDPQSWVWTAPPVVTRPGARVVTCR